MKIGYLEHIVQDELWMELNITHACDSGRVGVREIDPSWMIRLQVK